MWPEIVERIDCSSAKAARSKFFGLMRMSVSSVFFKKKIWRTSVIFVGPLIPLFWTSGDICPGFQRQSGSPYLHASSPVCNNILRFTSGATPANLLASSMAAELFSSTYL